MSECLPRQIDPRKFAQQAIKVKGWVPLGELQRLCDVLPSSEGHINADLAFGRTEQGLLKVSGVVEASVQNICQRCLANTPVKLDCQLDLAIIWSEEEAVQLPKSVDPWVVGEGSTDIYQVIEDELLLSLPIVSYCDYDCVPAAYFSSGEAEVEALTKQPANPFKVLESLKNQLSDTNDANRDKD